VRTLVVDVKDTSVEAGDKVAVHPVNAFQLEEHMAGQDIGSGTR
jgi:hypothetical protein